MRNLKRVLSLALALVMVLGMMVITTSAADFTDAEEITYTEAVDVMSALGILKGYEGANGTFTFNPKGTLNRQEAAKIIAFVCLGTEADDYLTGSGKSFDDVDVDHWAAKYIAFCKNAKIANGVNDAQTLFNPTGTLTVAQFAKMLLVAAGIEGEYTGPAWENNVKNAFEDNAVLKATGIKISTADITREEACHLALAAMKAGGTTTTYYYVVPTSATFPLDAAEKAAAYDVFTSLTDAYVLAGIMNGAQANSAKVLTDSVTAGTLLKEVYGVDYIASDADAFKNPGVGYEKTVNGEKVIDLFFGEESTLTYTTNMNTVAGKKAIIADLKAAKVELTELGTGNYRYASGLRAIVDGETDGFCGSTNNLAALTGDNAVVKVYIENKAVTKITVENTYAAVVTDVVEADVKNEEPAYIELNNDEDLVFVTDKFAKDDIVLYTIAAGEVQTVAEAEAVTGTLVGYTKDYKFTIGETVYELSDIALSNEGDVMAAMAKEMVYSLDENGKIIAVAAPYEAPEVAPVINDYAVVLSTNGTVKNTTVNWPTNSTTTEVAAQLQVLLADGTVEIWDLAILKADKPIANTSIIKGDYYYMMGKTPVEVAVDTTATSENATNTLKADLANNFSGIYTYADKALVASVTALTGAEEKDATVQFAGDYEIEDTTYVLNNGVILNNQTVFVLKELKADGSFKGYTVKTGLAALEETTTIENGVQVIASVTAGKNQDGEPDATKNVVVANLVIALNDVFVKDTSVDQTEDYVFVDETYAVSLDADSNEVHTYDVVYEDGTTGTIAIKVDVGYTELATGIYKLMADGTIDTDTGIVVAAAKEVKLISGTTVLFTDNTALSTNAKTVVVGGELAVEAEAYIVSANDVIVLAFIVE